MDAKKGTPKKTGAKMPVKTKKIPAKKEPIVPAPVMQPSELTELADLGTGSEATNTSVPVPEELKSLPDPYRMETALPQGKMLNKPKGKKNTMMK